MHYDPTSFEEDTTGIVHALRTCTQGWTSIPTEEQLTHVFENYLEAREPFLESEEHMWGIYQHVQEVAGLLLASNLQDGAGEGLPTGDPGLARRPVDRRPAVI